MKELFNIGKFLDNADAVTNYLLAINGVTHESRLRTGRKFSHLRALRPQPKTAVSIGVGQGEELHVLRDLYPSAPEDQTTILGVDIASSALKSAQQRSNNFLLEARFIMADGITLPMPHCSVSVVVLSAVLHEIFSYHDNGISNWANCIKETFRVLEPGGLLFVRDFLAPTNPDQLIVLTLKSQLAVDFFEYFIQEFRAFSLYTEFKPSDKDITSQILADVDRTRPTLPHGLVAELVIKFFYFYADYTRNGTLTGFSPSWKEINERYFIIDDQHPNGFSLSSYIAEICSLLRTDSKYSPACSHARVDERPEMTELLSEHFHLQLAEPTNAPMNSSDLLREVTSKMEFAIEKRLRD